MQQFETIIIRILPNLPKILEETMEQQLRIHQNKFNHLISVNHDLGLVLAAQVLCQWLLTIFSGLDEVVMW